MIRMLREMRNLAGHGRDCDCFPAVTPSAPTLRLFCDHECPGQVLIGGILGIVGYCLIWICGTTVQLVTSTVSDARASTRRLSLDGVWPMAGATLARLLRGGCRGGCAAADKCAGLQRATQSCPDTGGSLDFPVQRWLGCGQTSCFRLLRSAPTPLCADAVELTKSVPATRHHQHQRNTLVYPLP